MWRRQDLSYWLHWSGSKLVPRVVGFIPLFWAHHFSSAPESVVSRQDDTAYWQSGWHDLHVVWHWASLVRGHRKALALHTREDISPAERSSRKSGGLDSSLIMTLRPFPTISRLQFPPFSIRRLNQFNSKVPSYSEFYNSTLGLGNGVVREKGILSSVRFFCPKYFRSWLVHSKEQIASPFDPVVKNI